jgi:hypothetical protein
MTFGLTPSGFNAMRLADVQQFLQDAFIAQFGNINLDPQSVFGQEIGVLSKSFADMWENLEDVYFSQYPNSASGTSLDNVVQLNGITRLPATQTSVIASCGGIEGTYIPANSLASIPSSGADFYANLGGFITASNALEVDIEVGTITTQAYTVILSNEAFTYSLPIITFSNSGAIFVTGNVINVTLNGIALSPVNFTTNSNTTLAAIASAIAGFTGVASATVTNPNIISIVPSAGYNIVVSSIVITGGATQASYAITYASPANDNAITAALAAIINVGTPDWIATDNMDGSITIDATAPNLPFAASVGVNLSIASQLSPINFLCVDYGPIPCPVGALDNIVTPIAGWTSITNTVAGNTGTLIETDAQLRIRRKNSIALLGDATPSAITAGLLQKVPGVTSAIVFENVTLTQDPIVIIFPAQFNSGDTISVTYEPSTTFTVPYDTSQAQTMADLVAAFEELPQVSSASYGGSGNQTLTVNIVIANELYVTAVTTDVSDQTASITGGIPPKSFECVVQGGTDDAVANQIWQTKPAGIQTFGNTEVTITDSQGNSQDIYFTRPSQIYIWVEVALTLFAEENFPVNGTQLVAEAILNYGNSLGVGIDVLFQRVLSQIFTVPGIASGDMQIAATLSPTQSPSFGTSDITIADSQISVFNLQMISVTVA